MKKAGIIRCRQTEDMCPGTGCFQAAIAGSGAFAEYGPVEIIGFVSCGACPGKKAVSRAKMLVDRGAEMIVFASCIFKGTPIGFSCPNAVTMKEAVRKKIGENPIILDYTHL